MQRSFVTCQRLLGPSWHRLPLRSPARLPSIRHFSDVPSTSSSSSSSPSTPSSEARFNNPSLYSSSHRSSSIFPSPSGQAQSATHVPYVAYQSEYEDGTERADAADENEPTAVSSLPTSSANPPTPHAATTTPESLADTAADVESLSPSTAAEQSMMSAINQLTIEGLRNESATGPATINNKPMHAKYKPTSRKATTLHITPTHGTLTTLQLHRLLSLYALTAGTDAAQQQNVAERLAGRFGVDAGKVEQLVQAMAVGRVYDEAAGGGGVNPSDIEKDKCAVWKENEVPPNRRAVVQGAHLVTHLQAWEREKGSGRQQ